MHSDLFDGHPLSFAEARECGGQRACVTRVVSGHTVDAVIDLGMGSRMAARFRLRGITAPLLSERAGKNAREGLVNLVGEGYVLVVTHKARAGKSERDLDIYARYSADVSYYDEASGAWHLCQEALVHANLVKPT